MKNCLKLSIILIILNSCTNPQTQQDNKEKLVQIPLKYASGFTIEKSADYYKVTITTPYKDASQPLIYVFYNNGSKQPLLSADAYISIPVKSIVCTSTTHIPLLDYLDQSNALSGFPTLDYISSEAMRKRIDAGEIAELGIDDALNIEVLINIKPDMVMGYSLSGDFGQFNQISEAEIPVVLNAEYLEHHPLGRAEWIKLAGIIFDKVDEADSVFNFIEAQYLATLKIASDVTERPSVMSGIVYGDSWFLPGGKNYAAKMLQDGGFKYIWEADTTSAFLPLSFESVFDNANEADYWIGVGSFRSLDELALADSRYSRFRPFNQRKIFSYNKRIGAKGGSEFLELGYLRPDLILQDLLKISHPELQPNYELFFHFQLP